MARICCLNPDKMIIITCTIKKSSSIMDAKKCMVRADWAPKNIFRRNGYAAVIAGDMVRPVITIRGSKKNITIKYADFCKRPYCG